MTDREEVKQHWLRQNERRQIRNLPRWAKVRIERKAAKMAWNDLQGIGAIVLGTGDVRCLPRICLRSNWQVRIF